VNVVFFIVKNFFNHKDTKDKRKKNLCAFVVPVYPGRKDKPGRRISKCRGCLEPFDVRKKYAEHDIE
jgi:hypothetical protein